VPLGREAGFDKLSLRKTVILRKSYWLNNARVIMLKLDTCPVLLCPPVYKDDPFGCEGADNMIAFFALKNLEFRCNRPGGVCRQQGMCPR